MFYFFRKNKKKDVNFLKEIGSNLQKIKIKNIVKKEISDQCEKKLWKRLLKENT